MKETKDYSYGVVPVRKNDSDELKFLVIYQFSPVNGDHYWIFPKGHAEDNETPIQSALRELAEETSLSADITDETIFRLYYSFHVADTKINKEVQFFIGWIEGEQALVLQEGEVSEARWLTYEEARKQLTNENSKELLDKVWKHLRTRDV